MKNKKAKKKKKKNDKKSSIYNLANVKTINKRKFNDVKILL